MPTRLRVLHAIHDYLPAHQAGSELYTAALCAAQARAGLRPVVLTTEYDPGRRHGQVTWRDHAGIPVVEVVNTWEFATFADSYRSAAIRTAIEHVLDMVQPHVLHVHNLLNLSFDLPAASRARGIATVATLHDYTLVCPSGGQRIHREEHHLCRTIDPARCARCFRGSPFQAQLRAGQIARRGPGQIITRLARAARHLAPRLITSAASSLARAGTARLPVAAIERRLEAAHEAFAALQLVVAPSASLAREFARLGFPADRLVVSDYGFAPLPTHRRDPDPDGRVRVGFIGTLVWHKGADLLVEAAATLPADGVEIRIFGDPDVFPDYAHALSARAVGRPVRFMGPFDHANAAAAFAQLDALAVPSRWLENSPLVIHEAFMAGVPVIGSAIGGIVDLLEDGRGMLVPPDDAGALARAILDLVEQPARLQAIRARLPRVKSIDEDAREWVERYEALTEIGASELAGVT